MKKTHYFGSMLIVASILFGITACLDDDDNKAKELTDAEKTTILRNLSGDYTGKLHFYNPSHLDGRDSITVNWTVENDGYFECNDFPVAFLANFTGTTTAEHKALSSAPVRTYKAQLTPIQKEATSEQIFNRCTFRPQSYTYAFSVDYEGNTYNVSLTLVNLLTRTDTSANGSNFAAISDHIEYTSGSAKVMRMWAYLLLDKMTINSQTITINDYALFSGTRK